MTDSKGDRPYGSFPRHHGAPLPPGAARPDGPAAPSPARPNLRRRLGSALRYRSRRERALLVLITLLLVAGLSVSVTRPPGYQLGTVARPSPTPTLTVPELYAKLAATVVTVRSELADGQAGLGSGVIVDADASILTALHVVAGARRITVTFADGSSSEAKVFAQQPDNDIAAIRPSGHPGDLAIATLGNANALRVGDEAIVIGNPFGLTRSLSTGVVSGLHRTIRPPGAENAMVELIQFDASVNPGNSGGPLFDRNGDVVGIVSGLANPNGQASFAGIGFAVTIQAAGGAVGTPPD